MVPGALAVLEQRRRVVHVAHDEVRVAIVVEIADGQAPSDARDLQTRAGALRHVAEAARRD